MGSAGGGKHPVGRERHLAQAPRLCLQGGRAIWCTGREAVANQGHRVGDRAPSAGFLRERPASGRASVLTSTTLSLVVLGVFPNERHHKFLSKCFTFEGI